jgi:hemoglobin
VTESSLYERLGGAFLIAAVIDHFSDAVVRNSKVGRGSENPQLNEWSSDEPARLAGLKFMRTVWVCDIAGGPQVYAATKPGGSRLGLEEAHRDLKISPDQFDEVAAELARSLEHFNVPEPEKGEVLAAFARAQRRGDPGILLPVAQRSSISFETGTKPAFIRDRYHAVVAGG